MKREHNPFTPLRIVCTLVAAAATCYSAFVHTPLIRITHAARTVVVSGGDGRVSAQQCHWLAAHLGMKRDDFVSQFGYPRGNQWSAASTFFIELREDHWMYCTVNWNYRDRIRTVTLDLARAN